MSEIKRVASGATSVSPIVALAFASNDAELMSAHFNGRVRTIDWQVSKVITDIALLPLSATATEFDNAGSMLATASGQLPTALLYATDLEGIQAWRVADGSMQAKVPKVSSIGTQLPLLSTAIAFSSDGQLLCDSSDAVVIVSDVSKDQMLFGEGNFDLSLNPESDSYNKSLDALALDSNNRHLAAATRDGRIIIDEFRGKEFARHLTRFDLSYYVDAAKGKYALSLKYDPTGHWLALLTTHDVLVFNLQTREMQPVITLAQPIKIGKLAFNADGSLLAIASDNGVQVLDVVGKREIKVLYSEPVYALAFNHAQTLLAFGDTKGTIHVWGVPHS